MNGFIKPELHDKTMAQTFPFAWPDGYIINKTARGAVVKINAR